jgi:hypothetical protein
MLTAHQPDDQNYCCFPFIMIKLLIQLLLTSDLLGPVVDETKALAEFETTLLAITDGEVNLDGKKDRLVEMQSEKGI